MGTHEVDDTDSYMKSPFTRKNGFPDVNRAAATRLKEHRQIQGHVKKTSELPWDE